MLKAGWKFREIKIWNDDKCNKGTQYIPWMLFAGSCLLNFAHIVKKMLPNYSICQHNFTDKRYRILKSELEVEELAEDSEELFRRTMLDRYIDRPNPTFLKRKFATCDNICFASFCANYVLEMNKNDWQSVVLDESRNGTNHNERLLSQVFQKVFKNF